MSPFESPNYTQAPNDLFDKYMAEMSASELRVVLAIVRLTFGFQKTRARASISKLEKMTGLSRVGVLNGAREAEKRGLITKVKDGRVNAWIVNVVYQTSKRSLPPSIKETIKEKDSSAQNADNASFAKNGTNPTTETRSDEDPPKIKSDYTQTMEALERAFAKARGCALPSWEGEANAKDAQKRWRTPVNKMFKMAGGNKPHTLRGITEATMEMMEATTRDNKRLTFSTPIQILKVFESWIIDHPVPVKGEGIKIDKTGGINL